MLRNVNMKLVIKKCYPSKCSNNILLEILKPFQSINVNFKCPLPVFSNVEILTYSKHLL